jgi:hypothetical protein
MMVIGVAFLLFSYGPVVCRRLAISGTLESGYRNGAEDGRARRDRNAEWTKSRKHGRDRALRALERIFHELADALAERFAV